MRTVGAWCRVAAASLALAGSYAAQAALVTSDWLTSGDALVTRDTATNLDWLDLTVTDRVAYNVVLGRLSTDLVGWRVATASEAEGLFRSFGLPIEESFGPNPAAATAVRTMAALMGNTFADFFRNSADGRATGVYGFVDFSTFNGFHLQKGAFIDETGVFHDASTGYQGQPGDVRLYTGNTGGHANDSISFAHMGTFLVREVFVVPEPSSSALVLLAFGVLRLRQVRCRQKVRAPGRSLKAINR